MSTSIQSDIYSSIMNLQSQIDTLNIIEPIPGELEPESVSFLLNGKEVTIIHPDASDRLLYYLTDTLNLYATKPNCNQGFCGNCMVMMSSKSGENYKNENINSCLLRVVDCNGVSITTLEGLNSAENENFGKLHPIQEHFYVINALQCGYCTPGQIMTMYSNLQDSSDLPTFHTVENDLSGNLCRCTGYRPIIEAYKTLLIAVVEGNNNVLKETVIGDVNVDLYTKQYNELKEKWNVGGTDGLPTYNLNTFNLNNTDSDVVKNYLDEFEYKNISYKSDRSNGYTYSVPTSLEEFDQLMYTRANTKLLITANRNSFGVPGYEEYSLTFDNLISLEHVKELHEITLSNSGNYIFGAAVTQTEFKETLSNSSDLKYKEISNGLEPIASESVRNNSSCVSSALMTIKNGFRGDWATILSGSNAVFKYSIYQNNSKSSKSGIYSELKLDMDLHGNSVLVESVEIPQLRLGEEFKIYRSSKRPAHAQSYGNVCCTKLNDVSTITVGAVNDTGLQYISNVASLSEALSEVDLLAINDEYEMLNKESTDDSVRNIIKGFIVKFYSGLDYDLKDKITSIGSQTYNSGTVLNTEDDYPVWTLNGKADKHKMIKEGSKLQQIPTRDQLPDITTIGTKFDAVGKLGPLQKKSFFKVQGKEAYATEVSASFDRRLEFIVSNIAKGTTDYNSEHNKQLLEEIRNTKGVICVLVNDNWFTETFGSYTKSDNPNPTRLLGFSDNGIEIINTFNNFQPLFNSWGPRTNFTDIAPVNSSKGLFDNKILKYSDLIGCVLTDNIELSREMARKLSEHLIHIPETPDLELVNENGEFKPNDILNDSNTLNRSNTSKFTKQYGRYTGISKDTPNNENYSKYINTERGDVWLGDKFPNTYTVGDTNGSTALVPNSENDKKCPFWASGEFVDTLGGGYNSGNGTGQTVSGEANGWMTENYDNWYKTEADYSGTLKSNSQHVTPMEGVSFTLMYTSGTELKLYIGSQDTVVFSGVCEVLKNLDPKYSVKMFDSNGDYVNSDKEGFLLDWSQMSSGGSFGYKYWYSVGIRLEAAILTVLLTEEPVKYMEFWENGEGFFLGRYIMNNLSVMSVDKTTNKITHLANDTYTVQNINSFLGGIAATTISDGLTLWNKIDNYASRNTLVQSNIGETQAQRGFGQTEGCALLHSIYSKGSALLEIPHWKLILNHVTQVEDRLAPGYPPTDSGNLFTSNPGFPNTVANLTENVWKDLQVSILKNLQNKRYPDNGTTNYTDSISDLESIKTAFGKYYTDHVEDYNTVNKFKKRGMSLVPFAYKIMNPFNSNFSVKLHIDLNSFKVNYDCLVVDHGTGSFLKGVSALADCLKLDPSVIHYISTNSSAGSGSLGHAGSVTTVQNTRAAMNGGAKLLEAMLSRYPVHYYYSAASPARNYTVTCPELTASDPTSAKITLSTGQVVNNGDTIDLKTVSGSDLMMLYNSAFPNKSLRGVTLFNGVTNPSALNTNPGDLTTNPAPDLHRELIIRTLDFEYAVGTGQAVQGVFSYELDYYKDLVDSTRPTYISEITKEHMMNRWPMICTYLGSSIIDTDAGCPSNSFGMGCLANNQVTAVFAAAGFAVPSGAGGQLFGHSLGGTKLLPLEPNNECGKPNKVYNGSLSGSLFGSKITTCDVVGRTIQDPHWYIDYGSSLSGFEAANVYNMALILTEIDVLTGEWKNIRTELIANTDRSINGLTDINQMEGGFHMGSGYVTSEDSSEMLKSGKSLRQGFWGYKIPIAKNTPEMFNAALLNVNNAYVAGTPYFKGVAEICTPTCAGAMGSSLRDCIRNFRESVTSNLTGSGLTNPYATDTEVSNRSRCSYMDDLFQVSVDKIRKHTSVPNDVLEYLVNN